MATSSSTLNMPQFGSEYLVIDHFLPPGLHGEIWSGFATAEYERARYGLLAPPTLQGGSLIVPRIDSGEHDASPQDLLRLADAVLGDIRCQEFLERCDHWDQLDLRRYIYPAGSGINWHLDLAKSAAFIYYAHPVWHVGWGGELIVADGDAIGSHPVSTYPVSPFYAADNSFDASHVLETSLAHCIFPKPNRLVLLRGGVPHILKKVDASVGDGFRASVSGFFIATSDPA